METTGWKRSQHHRAFFETISQPTLEVAWIHPRVDYRTCRALSFLISLLINSTHGSLYREFREDKGWTYGLDGFVSQRHDTTVLGLTFPVNNEEQVDFIRGVLFERIINASSDQELVEREIRRYQCSQVYNFQTANEIINSASYGLMTYGMVPTEAQWQEAVEAIADPVWRQSLVAEYLSEKNMGSVCFMPERREKVFARQKPAGRKITVAEPVAEITVSGYFFEFGDDDSGASEPIRIPIPNPVTFLPKITALSGEQ
jgi:predicted Zn-dependent peptidase